MLVVRHHPGTRSGLRLARFLAYASRHFKAARLLAQKRVLMVVSWEYGRRRTVIHGSA